MGRNGKRLIVVTATAALAIGMAGCGGGDDAKYKVSENQDTINADAKDGGSIDYLQVAVTEHLDPQRTYVGRDISNLGRLAYRSLVQFPVGTRDEAEGATPVPDLATDIGTKNEDATEWSFTLKDGPTWQDGKPVTCEDVAYGVSRTYATDVITGGPNYVIGYLDIPTDDDGSSAYKGPYGKKVGQDLYDKAVTCDDNTITFKMKKPWPDFPLAIAALRSFDPYRADQDKGDKSDLEVFSNGPYMLDENGWDEDSGGTFVRNPEWDPEKSMDDVRQAHFDSINIQVGLEPETIIDRLIADKGDDQNAIAAVNVTPAQLSSVTDKKSVADRASVVDSPFTQYLLPNFNNVTNVKVRQALALATNRAAYSGALGGAQFSSPAVSIVNPAVPGYEPNDQFNADGNPDIEAAKKLLEESGEAMPYPIKFTYPTGSEATAKAFAALKASYDEAGFDVTLDGLDPSGPYYETIQKPDSDSDLMWGGWGADWPNISTVIPPLFDSRLNLTKASNGQDYGNYESDSTNSTIDANLLIPDLDEANAAWAELDKKLSDEVAYIPLDTAKFFYLRGSNITNYTNATSTSGYPDLGVLAVK